MYVNSNLCNADASYIYDLVIKTPRLKIRSDTYANSAESQLYVSYLNFILHRVDSFMGSTSPCGQGPWKV